MRVAIKGDSLDLGFCSSGAFYVYPALCALGIPISLLASDHFIAGVVYIMPILRIAHAQTAQTLEGSADVQLVARVSMALGGNISGVRLRAPDDPGELSWYMETLIPDAMFCALVQQQKWQEAAEYWRGWCHESGAHSVFEAALRDVAAGLVDPRDFEAALGPIQWNYAIRDRLIQGYEMDPRWARQGL